jgi:hypothetical protein
LAILALAKFVQLSQLHRERLVPLLLAHHANMALFSWASVNWTDTGVVGR